MKKTAVPIHFRALKKEDPHTFHKAFEAQGWNKPAAQFQAYLKEQMAKERAIIVAILNEEFAGYLTIKWKANYTFFYQHGIPEIVDFNVLKKFRRQGIGNALMEQAEAKIKKQYPTVGIGFGITADYGPAQILYAKRGYLPLGHGLTLHSKVLQYGDEVTINDDLVIHLWKHF